MVGLQCKTKRSIYHRLSLSPLLVPSLSVRWTRFNGFISDVSSVSDVSAVSDVRVRVSVSSSVLLSVSVAQIHHSWLDHWRVVTELGEHSEGGAN